MTLKLNQRGERQRLSINYGFLSSRRCHYHVAKSHKLVIKPSAVDASQQLSSSQLATAETTTIMHSNALERDFLFSRAIFSFGVEHRNAISSRKLQNSFISVTAENIFFISDRHPHHTTIIIILMNSEWALLSIVIFLASTSNGINSWWV